MRRSSAAGLRDATTGKTTKQHTVDVMSTEQISQWYLTPPSPPRVTVFFLMTPISSRAAVGTWRPAPGKAQPESVELSRCGSGHTVVYRVRLCIFNVEAWCARCGWDGRRWTRWISGGPMRVVDNPRFQGSPSKQRQAPMEGIRGSGDVLDPTRSLAALGPGRCGCENSALATCPGA